MLPTMVLVGLAFGLGFSSLTVAATAVVEAGGAGTMTSPSAVLGAYRPALGLITAISAAGALVAISGLRRRSPGLSRPAGR